MRRSFPLIYVLYVLLVLAVPCAFCEIVTTITSTQVTTEAAPNKIPRAGADGTLAPSWGSPSFGLLSTASGKAKAARGSDTLELKVTGAGGVTASGKVVTINVTPPVATTTTPGVVAVGSGLSIDPITGKLNNTGVAGVASFAGRGGAVTPQSGDYSASQITGLAQVAKDGSYNSLLNLPNIPAAQVPSDWNAVTGPALILNKPAIPAAQVPADWNAVSGAARILNKPAIPGALSQLSEDATHRTVTDAEKAAWNLNSPTVSSVNGQMGAVTLGAVDVGADPLGSATSVETNLNLHTGLVNNPHQVTKAQVGLGSVPNVDATTTANITDSTNKRFVTDAQRTVLQSTSGTNTGDETAATIKAKLGITTLSGSNTGDQDLSGLVPKTTTVNSKALSGNITIAPSDLTQTASYRFVTDTEKSTWNGKQNALVAGTDYATPAAVALKADKDAPTITTSVTAPVFISNAADHYIDCSNTGAMNTTGWGTAETGRFCYDKTLSKFRFWNGTALTDMLGTGTSGVTSVAMTVPNFLSVTGSPVTSSGTLAVALAAGYYIPTTTDQTIWNGKQAALSLVKGTYTTGKLCSYNSTGTLLDCNTSKPATQSCSAGYHLSAFDSTTGAFTCSQDSATTEGITDANAVHVSTAGEIAVVPQKVTPTTSDWILIEDAAAGNAKKRVNIGSLPASGTIGGSTGSTDRAILMASGTAGSTIQASGITVSSDNSTITTAQSATAPDSLTLRSTSARGTNGVKLTVPDAAITPYSIVFPAAAPSANTFFAAPNGSAGAPNFRTLVAADLPVHNAATATALAANGANCSAGNYPLGVDAGGAAESCTALPVVPSTITCGAGNHVSAYNPATGAFTCSADTGAYTFNSSSVVNTTGNIALAGDAATPGNSKYYGTNSGGTKGYYDLPVASGGVPGYYQRSSATTILTSTYGTSAFFENTGGTLANATYLLPAASAAAGMQYCFFNQGTNVNAQKIAASTGNNINLNGVFSTSAGYAQSAGALGDKICFVSNGVATWIAFVNRGTWNVY